MFVIRAGFESLASPDAKIIVSILRISELKVSFNRTNNRPQPSGSGGKKKTPDPCEAKVYSPNFDQVTLQLSIRFQTRRLA